MTRIRIAAAFLAAVCGDVAAAQQPSTNKAQLKFLPLQEIIQKLPGRWEYRYEDGWKPEMLKQSIRCNGSAERIWLDRGAKGVVYHSQGEAPGSDLNTSPIGTEGITPFQKPLIRIQYQGLKGRDADGKPVIWEIWMTDADTFYWRVAGWPAGLMTPPIRRCKEQLAS